MTTTVQPTAASGPDGGSPIPVHRVTPTHADRSRGSTVAQVFRLIRTELRLFLREPQAIVFVFGFPVITVLVLGSVFGNAPGEADFEGVNPQHFYTAAYLGVVLCAVALVMLPVHLASYRERGVLRRFDTSGFPRWAVPLTVMVSGVVFAVLGFGALLVVARLAFSLPPVDDPARTLIGVVVGTLAFTSLGVALGSVLPTARAAQGVGLLLFFPLFLLSGGGPPPQAMSDNMRSVSDWLPLSHVIRAVQEPWLGLGTGSDHLAVTAGVLVVSTAVWVWRAARTSRAS